MRMIIANRLTDGRVVFLSDPGGWVDDIEDGLLVDSGQDAEHRLQTAHRAVDANVVVDPYVIDVLADNGQRRPALVRERIRAFGPSVSGNPNGR